MPSNPKESKWRAPSQEARKRKLVTVTLSDEARAKLARLAKYESKSEVVERLIVDAKE